MHRVMAPLGLANYFYFLFPGRRRWELQPGPGGIPADGRLTAGGRDQSQQQEIVPVHSPQADALIQVRVARG